MKKAVTAGLLLLAMVAASGWNVRFLDDFTDAMVGTLERSRECWAAGDVKKAAALAESVLEDWLDAAPYTHIFIRHAEVDAATDAFYDLLAALEGDDGPAGRIYDRLEAHLGSIDDMEHVTVRSVF